MAEHFDAVIVGSGFGGSITAYELAEAGLRVCLLVTIAALSRRFAQHIIETRDRMHAC